MCDSCVAETIDIGEVLPHWYLVQATKKSDLMDPGDYGLIWMNDASYVWAVKPELDPAWEADHEERDTTPEENAAFQLWFDKVTEFEDCLDGPPLVGYKLVKACYDAGYTASDGRLAVWLFDRLAEFLLKKEAENDLWKAKISVPGYEPDERDKQILRALNRKHNDPS
jgi:hypothetical protein